MRTRPDLARLLFPTSLVALLLLLGALGRAAPGAPGTLPTSELRRGMKGYGLTVFEGTRITRFPITVLGIARGYLSGADLVLIRVDAGYLVDHGIGIVAGMSGSPIYVQDRLVGALSYGWGFSKEPIGGVTPIQNMMAELPGSLHPAPALAPWGAPGRLEEPITLGRHSWREVRLEPRPTATSNRALVLSPITTLLQTSGLDPGSLEHLNRSLAPLPLRAIQGFQGPRPRGGIPPMVPGAAVGVPLLTGDMEIASTGTLTWRQGDAILAFGHPLAEFGEVRLPLSAAHVHTVLPSYQMSFKMASQLGVIGEMTRDRLWAIGGRLHAPVPLVPVRLEVQDPTRNTRRTWNLRAAQHRFLTAAVLASAASHATASMSAALQASTASLKIRIQPVGLETLEIDDLVEGPNLAGQVAGRVDHNLRRLVDNPFEPVRLQSVEIQARVVPEPRQAAIERVYTDRNQYLPGQTVRLGIVLKPYGQSPQVREVEFPLPPDCPPGKVRLGVSSREALPELRRTMNLEEPAPTDLASLLQDLRREERGPDLALRVLLPGEGLRAGARSLPLPPSGWRRALATSTQSHLTRGQEVVRQSLATPWVLRGKALLEVEVRAPEAAAPPRTEAPPTPAPLVDLAGSGRSWTVRGRSPGGEFLGAALDGTGSITVGPTWERLYRSSDAAACSLARSSDGSLLVGLLGSGEILRLAPGRPAEVFARTGTSGVLSMAQGPDGLWAGTAGEGTLLHWGTPGQPPRRLRVPASYLWALLPAPGGGVYAATGLPGGLVRIEASGRVHPLWSAGAPHVRGLAALPDGRLLLALAGSGRLVRLDPTTLLAETLFQSPSPEVEALAVSGSTVWLACGPTVYRLSTQGGPAHPVPTGPALCLAGDGAGGAWAGLADGSVALLAAGSPPLWLPAATPGPVLALLPEAGGVLAARAFPAEVLRLGTDPAEGRYLSPILDAGRPSRWGRLRWLEVPGAAGPVRVHTRSGPTASPDANWSAWSAPLTRPLGQQVPSPPARFLQIRVDLSPDGPQAPRVQSLQLGFSALPAPPTVTWVAPQGSERWSGTQTLRWRLTDGDPAAILYDVELSADGGHTWTPLTRQRPGLAREEVQSLATSRFPDGVYLVRLTAWDPLDPPGTRVQALTGALLLANSKARVEWLASLRPGHPRGLAEVPVAAITEVHYRRGRTDSWKPARPVDGLLDSNREEFELEPGELTRVEVRVKDEAGNQTLMTGRPPSPGQTAGGAP